MGVAQFVSACQGKPFWCPCFLSHGQIEACKGVPLFQQVDEQISQMLDRIEKRDSQREREGGGGGRGGEEGRGRGTGRGRGRRRGRGRGRGRGKGEGKGEGEGREREN